MPDVTDREWDLLMESLRSNITSIQAMTSGMAELRVSLAERFLTKAEDQENDDERISELKAIIRIMQWVIGGLGVAVLAIAGWVAMR